MSSAKKAPVLLSLKDVSHSHGRVLALQGLNFSIALGESVALVGANGSGKSTLLRLMQGLFKPSQGSVYQVDVKRQAFVFQKPWMLRTSVLTNVALAAWLRGMAWKDAPRPTAINYLDRAYLHRAGAACRKRDSR